MVCPTTVFAALVHGFSARPNISRSVTVHDKPVPGATCREPYGLRPAGTRYERQIGKTGSGGCPATWLRIDLVGHLANEPAQHGMRSDGPFVFRIAFRAQEPHAVCIRERLDLFDVL